MESVVRLYQRHPNCFLFFVGSVSVILCVMVALSFLWIEQHQKISRRSNTVMNVIDDVVGDRDLVLEALQEVSDFDCSERSLKAYRLLVYQHRYVSDILVFGKNRRTIRCTALSGVLEEPIQIGEPDFKSQKSLDREFWLKLHLPYVPGQELDYLARSGPFGIYLSSQLLEELMPETPWQIFVPDGSTGSVTHLYGDKTLSKNWTGNSLFQIFRGPLVKRCPEEGTHGNCLLMHVNWQRILTQNVPYLFLTLVLACTIATLFCLFLKKKFDRITQLTGRIEKAVQFPRTKSFFCEYQPIIETNTGHIVGCEVLARFKDRIGPSSPVEFIPIIETLGLTWIFTELILRETKNDLLKSGGLPPGFRVSVNFFPQDLEISNLKRLRTSLPLRHLLQHDIQLVCEIVETKSNDITQCLPTFQFFEENNIAIAIDDFGTGYSNIDHLVSIDADYLKIDKSYVQGITDQTRTLSGALLPHIVAIANEVKVKTIAEGVETIKQLEILKRLSTPYVQGFLISRPVNAKSIHAQINRGTFLMKTKFH